MEQNGKKTFTAECAENAEANPEWVFLGVLRVLCGERVSIAASDVAVAVGGAPECLGHGEKVGGAGEDREPESGERPSSVPQA